MSLEGGETNHVVESACGDAFHESQSGSINEPVMLPNKSGTKTNYIYEIPVDLEVIKYDEALGQVGGDKEFFDEIMNDLKNEINEAIVAITEAMKINDFQTIGRFAHRIKGSAAYMLCERLEHICKEMQMVSTNNCMGDFERIELFSILFELFKTCCKELD